DDDKDNNGGSATWDASNKGQLLIDATCTPADITFPTDLKILNGAREKSERIIDILHQPHRGKLKKPRTYRKQARKQFLSVAKSKKVSKSKMRKAMRKQLGYLGRNLKTINKLSKITPLLQLNKRMYKLLLVINEVYLQQKWMYEQRINRIDDRIVNIYQPHVRPIKRGKAGAGTEFGAKISVSA
ncbi:MAG: IS5/IS1182 family transposase, partial [Desulfobacteraceae bacterium]|nr:IS5/IS1182 family transposase [Desulfobacteraceae bacterium]